MARKSRFNEFQKVCSESSTSLSRTPTASRSPPIELSSLHPTGRLSPFLSQTDTIAKQIDKIEEIIQKIDYSHREALQSVNTDETHIILERIDSLVTQHGRLTKSAQQALSGLGKENKELSRGEDRFATISPSDLKIRCNQCARLSQRLLASSQQFQTIQATFQTKHTQQLERQYLLIKPTATLHELEQLREGDLLDSQQIFSLATKKQASNVLESMKERYNEIESIRKSIMIIHQMFTEISLLVDEQGELVDRINDQVDSALTYTEQAAVEVRGTLDKRRGIQKKKWILLVIVLVVLIAIGIIIWLALRSDE